MNCLRGKRVGFIGFGSIAQATAELCRALRMRLVAHCRRDEGFECVFVQPSPWEPTTFIFRG